MPERFGSNESTFDALRGLSVTSPLTPNGDLTYLRLDATNDPVTGPLDIVTDDANALRVLTTGSGQVFRADTVANKIEGRLNESWVQETKYLVVDAGGLGDYTTLQAAINHMDAVGGGPWVVLVRSGTYNENFTFNTVIGLPYAVTFIGLGGVEIIGGTSDPVMYIAGPYATLIEFRNITFTHDAGSAAYTFGVGNGNFIRWIECAFNTVRHLFQGNATLDILDCTIGRVSTAYNGLVRSNGASTIVAHFYRCLIQGAANGGTGLVEPYTGNTFYFHFCTIVNTGAGFDIRNLWTCYVGRCLYATSNTSGAIIFLNGDLIASNLNAGGQALMGWQVGGANKWALYVPASSNDLRLYDYSVAGDVLTIAPGGAAAHRIESASAGILSSLTLDAQGSGAANDGGLISMLGKTSTTLAQGMAALKWLWATATHASRKARIVGTLYDTAERQWLQVDTDGASTDVLIDSLIYGSMWADDISQTITVSVISTEYKLAAGLTGGTCNGFTFQSSKELLCNVGGTFKIDWGMSISSGTNNENLDGGIYVNASTWQHNTEGSSNQNNSNNPVHVGGTGIIALSVNDVVGLYVENESGAHNITVRHANLSIVRIGA